MLQEITLKEINKNPSYIPLEQQMEGCGKLYEKIRDACILFVCGMDDEQRVGAAKEILTHLPEEMKPRIGCLHYKGKKNLFLTTRMLDEWKYLTSVPENVRAYKSNDIIQFTSVC